MLTCNRTDLAWALRAVLEHVGPTVKNLDFVGMDGRSLWATDGYTAGIAHYEWTAPPPEAPTVLLPLAEVKGRKDMIGLYQLVRTDRVRDREDQVEIITACSDPLAGPRFELPATHNEMHVCIRDKDWEIKETAVFELLPSDYPPLDFDRLWQSLQGVKKNLVITDQFVMDAELQARFKTAKRNDGDRMRWWPASPAIEGHGQRALVTVGSDFLGAIIGLGEPTDKEAVFGDSTLEDWGL